MTDTLTESEVETTEVPEVNTEGVTDMSTLWNILSEAIADLDKIIESWDPEAGVRRQFLDSLIAENGEKSAEQANRLVEQLNTIDEHTRYSIYLGFISILEDKLGKPANKWVAEQIEGMPKPEKVEVPKEVREAVVGRRQKYYGMVKQLFDTAQLLDIPGSEEWTMPKIRRLGAGPRGKRALSLYNFWLDGVELTEDDNSPAGVAKLLFGAEAKSSALTKALKGLSVIGDDGKPVKLNTSKPPKEFEVTINGKVLSASRIEGTENVEEDTEDEDDDDNGEDEEVA